MQLKKLYANKSSFRTVEFNETGLSFIVAKQKNPDNKNNGKTYNGVGKSLLVKIIHFCMGIILLNIQLVWMVVVIVIF